MEIQVNMEEQVLPVRLALDGRVAPTMLEAVMQLKPRVEMVQVEVAAEAALRQVVKRVFMEHLHMRRQAVYHRVEMQDMRVARAAVDIMAAVAATVARAAAARAAAMVAAERVRASTPGNRRRNYCKRRRR